MIKEKAFACCELESSPTLATVVLQVTDHRLSYLFIIGTNQIIVKIIFLLVGEMWTSKDRGLKEVHIVVQVGVFR
jgi:hypothetical protein